MRAIGASTGRPRTSRSSRTLPATTATAPAERSWSWKPVSWSWDQQMQPDVEVLVAQQLLVGPLGRVVLDVCGPELRSRRDLGRDGEQLLVGQVASARSDDALDALDHASLLPVGGSTVGLGWCSAAPGRARRRRRRRGVDDGAVGAVDELAAPTASTSPRASAARRRRCRRRPAGRGRRARCRRGRRSARAAAGRRRRASRTGPAGGDGRGGRRGGRRTRRPASGRRSRSGRATRRAARRRPPAGRGAATGPGWTKSGASWRSSRASSGATRSSAAGVASAVAGSEMPTQPRRDHGVDVGRVGRLAAHRAPAPEAAGSASMPRWWASSSGCGLLGRQRLDPERGGERDQRPVDPLPPQLLRPQRDVGRREGEDAVGLAGDAEGPPLAARPTQCRRPAAPGQLRDQRLGEKMLVDVYSIHCCVSLSRISTYEVNRKISPANARREKWRSSAVVRRGR